MQTIELERLKKAASQSAPNDRAAQPPSPELAALNAQGREDPAHLRLAPGLELHPKVYASVLFSTIVFVIASWLAFGRDGETDYLLLIVALIFFVFATLPTLIFLAGRKAARAAGARKPQTLDQFMEARVETGSGALTGKQAWVQIAVIPLSLALAAILIGLASAVSI